MNATKFRANTSHPIHIPINRHLRNPIQPGSIIRRLTDVVNLWNEQWYRYLLCVALSNNITWKDWFFRNKIIKNTKFSLFFSFTEIRMSICFSGVHLIWIVKHATFYATHIFSLFSYLSIQIWKKKFCSVIWIPMEVGNFGDNSVEDRKKCVQVENHNYIYRKTNTHATNKCV